MSGNPRIAEAGKPFRFGPGNNANPLGRMPQSVRLAKRLMEETNGGEDLVRLIIGIALTGETEQPAPRRKGDTDDQAAKRKPKRKRWTEQSRRWATEMLVDRIWGRAVQHIDLSVAPAGTRLNRAALSDDEAQVYATLVRKMATPIDAPQPAQLPASPVVDAQSTPVDPPKDG